jgi:hypothetical protein
MRVPQLEPDTEVTELALSVRELLMTRGSV